MISYEGMLTVIPFIQNNESYGKCRRGYISEFLRGKIKRVH